MLGRRALAVNADDFGFTKDVNEGIVVAHRDGILTSTTLMANGAAFHDAVRLARENPSLDIGVHLVLVGGPGQPATVAELIRAIAFQRMHPYDELKLQVERILAAGLQPTHLDTHKHTHLLPPVLDAIARIGHEFGITWVRRPMDFPLSGAPGEAPLSKRILARSFSLLRRRFERVLAAHGCRTTDYFAGFSLTGRFTAADLVHLIRHLPEGTTELMCHPGYCRAELRAARTRLKESREAEMRALMAPEVRAALEECGVELCSYPRLA